MNFPKQLSEWFTQRQSKLCHRQLLVISGQEEWATNAAATLLANHAIPSVLWVADDQNEYENINIKDYRSKLGHEYDWVVLNSFSGFRANAVMALSGTIKAQGLMVVLCPELSDWENYRDPEQHNRISYGFQHKHLNSHFIVHLIACFNEDSSVAVLSANTFSGEACLVADNLSHEQHLEQEIAVKSIAKVALGHRNRPLVLTADRGRGKSSALGIAAAQLMQTAEKTIWVSAPHIRNLEQVFFHVKRLLPEAVVSRNTVTYQSSSLIFKPADVLLESENAADLLLIDEASAIPVHVLSKLAKKFPRVVFSSTVHGYEGSGRGFEMRFIEQLAQLKPNFKRLHISQPIRWHHGDTLEQFWFNTLFHNTSQITGNIGSATQTVSCRHVSKTQLLNDKKLLADLFGLLIEAHYQTSQDDLQRLLDAPEIECFILTKGSDLLGVAQIIEEGGERFSELADNITDCSRRVKGHLVAQNIASTYNTQSFLLARQWRISRIAIAPEHQQEGLGKQLVEYLEQQAKQQGIEFLTTSFGCNPSILKFWYKSQFLLTKLSAQPEVSSGEHSGICIKPLTNAAVKMSAVIHQEFYQELLYQMDKNFQNISEAILMQILLLQPTANQASGVAANMQILRQFAIGKRAYSTCKRLLKAYFVANPTCFSKLAMQQQNFLVATLLQNQTDKELCAKFCLSGKKQIEQALKTNFEIILHKR